MNKRNLIIVAVIIIIIVTVVIFNQLKKNSKEKIEDEAYTITSLSELFPDKETKQTYADGNEEYEVNIKSVDEKDGVITIVSEYETTTDDVKTTIETTYEITSEKVTESGKYTAKGSMVSIIYPTEIIVGIPYLNMTWKSTDGLITNTVVNMKNNQVTIESVKKTDIYEEGETKPISKEFKETRIYEKGKGIVLYRTEIVGEKDSVYEKKLKK